MGYRMVWHPSMGGYVSIRSWSLTRYWAMTFSTWLLAFALLSVLDEVNDYAGPMAPVTLLALAFAPAFWAGSWAGSHPEIGLWPAGRILVMWFLGAGVIVLVGGPLQDVGGFALGAVVAPLTVLTWAWKERRSNTRLLSKGE